MLVEMNRFILTEDPIRDIRPALCDVVGCGLRLDTTEQKLWVINVHKWPWRVNVYW